MFQSGIGTSPVVLVQGVCMTCSMQPVFSGVVK